MSKNKSCMSAMAVKLAIRELFGRERGAQRQFAAAIGKHEVTVSRMVTGDTPVGETEAILIRLLQERKRTRNFTTEINLKELD